MFGQPPPKKRLEINVDASRIATEDITTIVSIGYVMRDKHGNITMTKENELLTAFWWLNA